MSKTENRRVVTNLAWLIIIISLALPCLSQSAANARYLYDDIGRLIKVVDSFGNEVDYSYDAVGNIIPISRVSAPGSSALAVLDFAPQIGAIRATVTIQGQNFSNAPLSNAVTFNGVPAIVVTATTSQLTVTVPTSATTGPIAVTVNGSTATTTSPYTVVTSPAVLSVNPQFAVSSSAASIIASFTVSGANLTGATFSFAPAFSPPAITVNSATINAGGTSATLNLTVGAGVKGNFTLLASNAAGSSSPIATASNTLQIISPNDDADGDGVINAVEIALGSNPLNAQTSGAGIPDGWQVFYGLNPLSAASAGPDPGKSGDTALYDFQNNLSPVNPNRVPPTVTQISPANGATGVAINTVISMHFGEALQIGVSLASAQSAIAAALGSGTSVSASSQAIAATTLQNYMNRTCCGNTVVSSVAKLSGPYGQVPGTLTPSSSGLTAVFFPSTPLQSNTQYSFQINGVRDAAGNLMTKAFTSTFTAGASLNQTPQVVLNSPSDGDTNVSANAAVSVTFDIALTPASVNQQSFVLTDYTSGSVVPGTIQLDTTGMTATFTPSTSLSSNHYFVATLTTAITGLSSGNSLAQNFSFSFSTGPVSQEADTLTFSVLNGTSTTLPASTSGEAESLTFSVLNGTSATLPATTSGEAESLTFSVLNGTSTTLPAPTSGEAETLTFSVLNGTTSTLPASDPGEIDSQTYSLLNGTMTTLPASSPGESDTLTFSVKNLASNVAGPATRKPPSGSPGSALAAAGNVPLSPTHPAGRYALSDDTHDQIYLTGDLERVRESSFGDRPDPLHAGAVLRQRSGGDPLLSIVRKYLLHLRLRYQKAASARVGAAQVQPTTRALISSRSNSDST